MPRAVLRLAQTRAPCFTILLTAFFAPVLAADPFESPADVLPPTLPWDGRSRELVVPVDDPWVTLSEKSGLTETPRYEETFSWLGTLVEAAGE